MQNPTFETAFDRLEQILSSMNSGKTGLDESLMLFEEADQLIKGCQDKLEFAEKKVETLIKDRNNNLQVDEEGDPVSQPFESSQALPQ